MFSEFSPKIWEPTPTEDDINQANTELKNLKTCEDLQQWIKRFGSLGVKLYSKRTDKMAFGFGGSGKRTYYLYDDTVNRGDCLVENLYKIMYAE